MGHQRIRLNCVIAVVVILVVIDRELCFAQQQQTTPEYRNLFDPQVSLTINPRTRHLQIYWSNLKVQRGDRILITDVDPGVDQFTRSEVVTASDVTVTTESDPNPSTTESDFTTGLYSLDKFLGLSTDSTEVSIEDSVESAKLLWKFGDPPRDVIYSMMIQEPTGWWKTNVLFNRFLFNDVTKDTGCYGYWVHMIDANGTVLVKNCWRANPRWMNELKEEIKDVKMRNLFIPGTHDSGSYKYTFTENLLTKYAVTQDDDIHHQLMHGIRYLDLRVGHYRKFDHAFYIVHSVIKFQPLIEVLEAVKSFVEETNEIVIIDFQEFPVGFHPNATQIHQKLVQFIYDVMKDHLIEPFGTWDVTMNDLWEKKGNVIIGYDKAGVQFENREMLWQSVEHFWPNRADVPSLVRYLKGARNSTSM